MGRYLSFSRLLLCTFGRRSKSKVMAPTRCKTSKRLVKQHNTKRRTRSSVEGKSAKSGRKQRLVCPKCMAVFKSQKTFERHMKVQTRLCRTEEKRLACGKEDS